MFLTLFIVITVSTTGLLSSSISTQVFSQDKSSYTDGLIELHNITIFVSPTKVR